MTRGPATWLKCIGYGAELLLIGVAALVLGQCDRILGCRLAGTDVQWISERQREVIWVCWRRLPSETDRARIIGIVSRGTGRWLDQP